MAKGNPAHVRQRNYILALLLFISTTACVHAQNIPTDTARLESVENWGAISPGKGFEIARTKFGTLNISAYMLARYIDQFPAADTLYNDHLGRVRTIDPRRDILWHRVMVWFQGWIYSPRLRYTVNLWTVNATNQVAVAGFMTYDFHKAFRLSAGINGFPGTRSLLGSHPLWLGTDRVMADESTSGPASRVESGQPVSCSEDSIIKRWWETT